MHRAPSAGVHGPQRVDGGLHPRRRQHPQRRGGDAGDGARHYPPTHPRTHTQPKCTRPLSDMGLLKQLSRHGPLVEESEPRRAGTLCAATHMRRWYSVHRCCLPQGSLGFELVEESNTPFLIREHGARARSPAPLLLRNRISRASHQASAPATAPRPELTFGCPSLMSLSLCVCPTARKFQYGVSHATVWKFRG